MRRSEYIPGNRGNYGWKVQFDQSSGYLGIEQPGDGSLSNRVLLCPRQVNELLKFLGAEKTKR